jgi:adenylate cyclase
LILLAALLLGRFSWNVPWPNPQGEIPTPVTGEAERAAYDLRVYRFAPHVEQDKRVLLVVYDDHTLMRRAQALAARSRLAG